MSNILAFPSANPSAKRRTLTPRQRQVVELAELRDADIALLLGNRKKTVKVLMRQAFDRLGVDNRTAAIRALERQYKQAA
jgi:DNA-binding NarL/FixJ family response regulator